MRIGNNIVGLQLSNRLQQTSQAISRSLERLSTGKRVNRPSDDIASFSQSINLDSKVRGLRQANLNINQASGLLRTAESAITTQIEIVNQMRELAVRAATPLASSDLEEINQSLLSLRQQYDQIVHSTQFNSIHLLDGSTENLQFLIGANPEDELSLGIADLSSDEVFEKTVGTGDFSIEFSSSVGNSSPEILVDDFNQDGNMDFAELDQSASTLNIHLGNGDGSFQPLQSYELDTFTTANSSFILGDFNNDDISDLIVSEDTVSSTFEVFIGNGDGSFEASTTFNNGSPTGASLAGAAGDINNDGNLDLVWSVSGATNVYFRLGNGDGTFGNISTVAGQDFTNEQRLADLDGDGFLDLIAISTGGKSGTPIISVNLNDGQGSFDAATTIELAEGAGDLQIGDLDRDGSLDALVTTNGAFEVLLNDGSGSLSSIGTQSATAVGKAVLVDFNGDSILDIIGSSEGANDNIEILTGNGDGTFDSLQTIEASSAGPTQDIAVADFDGDGVVDIVVSETFNDTYSILLGDGRIQTALADMQITDASSAQALLDVFDGALDKLSSERSKISSLINVLDSRIDSNLLLSESLTEAKNSIQFTDYALEVADLVRSQILQQAQVAALAQANLQVQLVSSLIDL